VSVRLRAGVVCRECDGFAHSVRDYVATYVHANPGLIYKAGR
jgi:hypothetical protein